MMDSMWLSVSARKWTDIMVCWFQTTASRSILCFHSLSFTLVVSTQKTCPSDHSSFTPQVVKRPEPQSKPRAKPKNLQPKARKPSQDQTESTEPQPTCNQENIRTEDCHCKPPHWVCFVMKLCCRNSWLTHAMSKNLDFILKEMDSPTKQF
jgi:hypothetical protein